MSKIKYSERIFNKVIILPLGIMVAFLLLALFSSDFQNDAKVLGILLPLIFLLLICIHLYQLKIQVSENELKLSLGIGTIKKSYLRSEIDLDSFQIEKVPFYLSGTGCKSDFKGNVVFSAGFGRALCFRLKNSPQKILIVAKDNAALEKALTSKIDYHGQKFLG
ncbi:MAG: hypothetical protein ACQESK_08950 [Bacteroidota bacterium]